MLAHHRTRGHALEARTLACVRGAVYFHEAGGPLLWLTPPGYPRHRRAILAETDLSPAKVGTSVSVRGGLLLIDGLPGIPIAEAICWSPRPVERSRLLAWDAVADRLPALAAEVVEAADRRGFGHLIGLPLGDSPEASNGDPDLHRWEAMFPRAGDLLRAGRAGGLAGVYSAAAGLIGLGPGLTPAGDDFLGGLLFAVEQVGRAHPGRVRRQPALRKAFLQRTRSATNAISYAILCDLAHGHGPEPMHTLLWSLLHEGEAPTIGLSAARAITHIGHTSGWDLLAGALCGLSLLVGQAGG